jgi:hypothetical protein
MAKVKSEPAAVERAMERFETLDEADKAIVLSRIEKGVPKMGLVDMGYVEQVYEDLSPAGKTYLLAKMKAPKPAPAPAAPATTK